MLILCSYADISRHHCCCTWLICTGRGPHTIGKLVEEKARGQRLDLWGGISTVRLRKLIQQTYSNYQTDAEQV